MRQAAFSFLFASLALTTHAQHHPQQVDSAKNKVSCVFDIFSQGHTEGNIRVYHMNTYHPIANDFYYATAFGGRINYHSASFHGFSLGIGGVFIFGMGNTDFNDTLETRFENQLFDIEHPSNINDLDRLEELFIQYKKDRFFVKLGKMDITTPLMNMQDTRMKPYVFRGVWSAFDYSEHLKFHAGFFDKASPRSTTHWYSIQDAIGIYNQGVDDNGMPMQYHQQLKSRGISVLGAHYHTGQFSLQAWNYHLDLLNNTTQIQVDQSVATKHEDRFWNLGLIYLHQRPTRGISVPSENDAYYNKQDRTNLISAKLEWVNKRFTSSINHTYIAPGGRFTFPREFGREQFYTTMSRGRLEGLGNVYSTTLKLERDFLKKKQLRLAQHFGYNHIPDSKDFGVNKYCQQSNVHYTFDLNYKFTKFFNGSSLRILYVYRNEALGEDLAFTPLHYHHFNAIFNIDF